MINLSDKIKKHYKLKDSIKEYKGYKVKSPEDTINTIDNAFKTIDLQVTYKPKNMPFNQYFPFKSGAAFLHPLDDKEIILLQSGGKGVTPILSQASGMAELIERFTGYGLLSAGNIHFYLSKIKLNDLWVKKQNNSLNFSDFEFNSMGTSGFIPSEFKEKYDTLSKNICYSLTNDIFYLYPEEFIVKLEGSNGLASGNSMEEAGLHAIIEVIERASGFYFFDNLSKAKKISKDSVTHPTLKRLMDSVDSIGFNFEMFDFSYLFDIPVIITVFDNPKWNLKGEDNTNEIVRYPKIIIGADTSAQDAAMRCFTEFYQISEPLDYSIYEAHKISAKFETAGIDIPEGPRLYLKTVSPYLSNGNPPLNLDIRKFVGLDHDSTSFDNIIDLYDVNQKVEIERIVSTLKKQDIEVFVHDITHPLLKFPVVRAILTGGKGYFSNIPFNGYQKFLLKEQDKIKRSSFLNRFITTALKDNVFYNIVNKQEWCHGKDLDLLIDIVKADISYNGVDSLLWGINVNKFYFLGMLYLKIKEFKKAEKCFNAALIENSNYLPALYGMAYILKISNNMKDYENIKYHVETLTDNKKSFEEIIKGFENPVISPNPLEPCDLKCNKRNKPYLCNNCFFNYVSEDVFMKKITDEFYS